jgi:hypothetical protein
MPLPDWTKSEDWDVLYLAGVRIAGVARVTFSGESGLDIQKPKGGRRATMKDDGDPPGKLEVELQLLPEDMEAFEQQIPLLRPTSKNGARDPLEIGHPEARLWGIHVVTIGPINSSHPESGGVKIVTFTAYEWAPAPAPVKKAATKPSSAGDWAPFIDDSSAGFRQFVTKPPSSDAAKNL